MNKFTFLLIVPILAGCVRLANINDDTGAPATEAPVTSAKSSTKNPPRSAGILHWSEAPQSYWIEFPISSDTKKVRKIDLTNQTEILIDVHENNFRDSDLQALHSYRYELLEDGLQILSTEQVQVPKDIVLDNNFEISTNTQLVAERLFIRNIQINTRNFNLDLVAKEIYMTNGSRIISFETSASAPTSAHGLPGGNISLTAEYAEGQISVELNGQNGGVGLNQTTLDNPPDAPNGSFLCEYQSPGAVVCSKTTLPQEGFTGRDAVLGGPGGNGGNTGSLNLNIRDKSNFKINVTGTPGKGGEGGRSSQPQKGGLGGIFTQIPSGCNCNSASRLPFGSRAKSGNDGRPTDELGPRGTDGSKALFCDQQPDGNLSCFYP